MSEPITGETLFRLLITLPLFLFSLTVHEYAHAWTAKRFGDRTAEAAGRLTLDPRPHIDPVGLLMFVLSSLAKFGFGWAKPVPVQLGNCREPLRAMYWIALAGPLSNLMQALAGVLLLVILGLFGVPVAKTVWLGVEPVVAGGGPLSLFEILACLTGFYVQVNLVLMVFNLIPVPPLDGGRILVSRAPHAVARSVASLEGYGFVVLLALMWFGVLESIFRYTLVPLLNGIMGLLAGMGLG